MTTNGIEVYLGLTLSQNGGYYFNLWPNQSEIRETDWIFSVINTSRIISFLICVLSAAVPAVYAQRTKNIFMLSLHHQLNTRWIPFQYNVHSMQDRNCMILFDGIGIREVNRFANATLCLSWDSVSVRESSRNALVKGRRFFEFWT